MGTDYDSLLSQAETGIEQVSNKLDTGRLKDLERERVRIEYIRELNNLLQTKVDILRERDRQQEAIETRVIAREAVEGLFDQFEGRLMERLSEQSDG